MIENKREFKLISKIREENENINIITFPGASSPIAALSISGIPTDNFHFIGFLPRKKGRVKKIKEISKLSTSIIIFL